MSLAGYYRKAFTEHAALPVVAPWPFGDKRAVLWVRPHYVSPFVAAITESGVSAPDTYSARLERHQEEAAAKRAAKARETRKSLIMGGKARDAERIGAVAEVLDGMVAALASSLPAVEDFVDEGWDLRYPIYTREELDIVAPLVGLHLVDRGGLVPAEWTEEDGEEGLEAWSAAEISGLFAEPEPVPAVYPDDAVTKVPFAGYPEAIAWAILALRTAVRKHLYMERVVPLDSDSPGPEQSADTPSEKPTSPEGSPLD